MTGSAHSPAPQPQQTAAVDQLLLRAQAALLECYAPYSRFAVGVAVETEDGQVFLGANLENASSGVTQCAEQGAIQAALAAGKMAQIRRVAIVGHPIGSNQQPQLETPPCGRCRQVMAEVAQVADYDLEVWFASFDLKTVRGMRISQLLPHSYGSRDLARELRWPHFSALLRQEYEAMRAGQK